MSNLSYLSFVLWLQMQLNSRVPISLISIILNIFYNFPWLNFIFSCKIDISNSDLWSRFFLLFFFLLPTVAAIVIISFSSWLEFFIFNVYSQIRKSCYLNRATAEQFSRTKMQRWVQFIAFNKFDRFMFALQSNISTFSMSDFDIRARLEHLSPPPILNLLALSPKLEI